MGECGCGGGGEQSLCVGEVEAIVRRVERGGGDRLTSEGAFERGWWVSRSSTFCVGTLLDDGVLCVR